MLTFCGNPYEMRTPDGGYHRGNPVAKRALEPATPSREVAGARSCILIGNCFLGATLMGYFSVDLGAAVPYVVESFLALIGKDAATKDVTEWFCELQRVGLEESSYVQAVGMHQPVPIEDMYQPTTLIWLARHVTLEVGKERKTLELPDKPISFDAFVEFPGNVVILAGPGWGKTTLVRFVFQRYARTSQPSRIPVLFPYRDSSVQQERSGTIC